jgi:hypothetical protein
MKAAIQGLGSTPNHAAPNTNGSDARWFQWIDATHALNRSAGVSYPSVCKHSFKSPE